MAWLATFLRSLALLIATTFAASAGPFEDARQLWLEGDDIHSLPLLASLARAGDTNARILLARIESMDKGLSPYRSALGRREAIELFRYTAPGLPFGKSWLEIEAGENGNILAAALMEARRPDGNSDLVRILNGMGEREASEHQIRILVHYGRQSILDELRLEGEIQDELLPFLEYSKALDVPNGYGLAALSMMAGRLLDLGALNDDEEAVGIARTLAFGFRYGDTSKDNRWRGYVEDWLQSSPATEPLRGLCSEICPDNPVDCSFAALAITGGYYEAIRLDSPVETLIPQSDFLASPRARIMSLRRIALANRGTDLSWLASYDEIAEMSVCLADTVRSERTNYLDIR